jgi:hypothetical protein
MTAAMSDFDSSYRTPRSRSGMDPNTRKLAIIAGSIGGALAVIVAAWSFTGGRGPGGVPVVEADSRPLRVKPEKQAQGPEVDDSDDGRQALAPTPEAPKPQALKAQAEAAAAAAAAAASRPTPPSPQPVALTSPVAPSPVAPSPVPALPAAPAATSRPASPPPAAAAAPAPAKPPAAAGKAQVQLAAVGTAEAARDEWSRLQKRMPDILGGRTPAVLKYERDGKTLWRLRTGGFASNSEASSFCQKVRAKGGNCSVAAF